MSVRTQSVRSNSLVHWTGRDIQVNCSDLEVQREKYLERLRSTLLEPTNGLWMNNTRVVNYQPTSCMDLRILILEN